MQCPLSRLTHHTMQRYGVETGDQLPVVNTHPAGWPSSQMASDSLSPLKNTIKELNPSIYGPFLSSQPGCICRNVGISGRITPAYFPPAAWHPGHPTNPARQAPVTEVKVKYTQLLLPGYCFSNTKNILINYRSGKLLRPSKVVLIICLYSHQDYKDN